MFQERLGVKSGQPHEEGGESISGRMHRVHNIHVPNWKEPPGEAWRGRTRGLRSPERDQRWSPSVVAMSGAWNLKGLRFDFKLLSKRVTPTHRACGPDSTRN